MPWGWGVMEKVCRRGRPFLPNSSSSPRSRHAAGSSARCWAQQPSWFLFFYETRLRSQRNPRRQRDPRNLDNAPWCLISHPLLSTPTRLRLRLNSVRAAQVHS